MKSVCATSYLQKHGRSDKPRYRASKAQELLSARCHFHLSRRKFGRQIGLTKSNDNMSALPNCHSILRYTQRLTSPLTTTFCSTFRNHILHLVKTPTQNPKEPQVRVILVFIFGYSSVYSRKG